MDLKTLERKLIALDQVARDIQKECGYTSLSNSMENVELDVKDPDAYFLYHELKDILHVLGFVHFKLDYLQKAVTHEGILQYNKKGYELDGVKLRYDSKIEILTTDEDTHTSKWELRFLTEHSNIGGMRARIRE